MDEKKGVDSMFNDMIKTIKEKQVDLDNAIAEYTGAPVKPPMDVIETEDEVVVKTDLPGFKREDIKIDLTEDTLEIRAEFSKETEEEGEEEGVTFHRKERRFGSAARTYILPSKIIIDDVTANFKDGVLTVTMPKLEKKETFNVKID